MESEPVTIIISDLHVGGGSDDLGDDHIYQDGEFAKFLRHIEEQEKKPAGSPREIELIINGDFLEFAQVEPEVYKKVSPKYWCSEGESLDKLRAILRGHHEIFAALKDFQTRGHRVTIAAGNHDVDLYWPEVRKELEKAAGPVKFELGKDWYFRYDDRLAISHGHAFDPANRFKHWNNPIRVETDPPRLEMCPGTLFMVRFVNPVERKYPFVDNIKPVTALRSILWKEDRPEFWPVAYLLFKFADEYPVEFLSSSDEFQPDIGVHLLAWLRLNGQFAEGVAELYRRVRGERVDVEGVRRRIVTEEQLREFLYEMIAAVPLEDWTPVFRDVPAGNWTLEISKEALDSEEAAETLSILRANFRKEKEALREIAGAQLLTGREVVVMGHTHQPDEVRKGEGGYFNPGSWTRFVDLDKAPSLTLKDLRNELAFPYQINYVRVERLKGEKLHAEKVCFKKAPASFQPR